MRLGSSGGRQWSNERKILDFVILGHVNSSLSSHNFFKIRCCNESKYRCRAALVQKLKQK